MEKVFLKECYITDIIKYDALTIWSKIKVGTSLTLRYEPIPFDEGKKVLFVYMKGNQREMCRIGCLAKEDAAIIEQVVNMGWEDTFTCNISYIDESSMDNQRIKIAIYIRKNAK